MVKIFDSHFHIIENEYPLVVNERYSPDQFRISDYKRVLNDFELLGGVLVAASYHGFDHRHITGTLRRLGQHFVGVAQVPYDISDDELHQLAESRIKAVRFNIKRGVHKDTEKIRLLAERVYTLFGWHSEFYMDPSQLNDLYGFLLELPRVSIDHMGLSESAYETVLKLAEKGVRIKATGFGRLDLDIKKAVKDISEINEDVLMFGTDLPSTRANRVFNKEDIYMIMETVSSKTASKILYKNALSFYGIRDNQI